jgi:hypothetical protein
MLDIRQRNNAGRWRLHLSIRYYAFLSEIRSFLHAF